MERPLAVITGASSGIGLVFARRLAADHDLLLIARRQDRLNAAAAEIQAQHGAGVEILCADLAQESDLRAVAARIAGESNLVLLVNNAGFGYRKLFWEGDLENLERMHRLHIMAIVRLSHAALGGMVARDRGAIINVSSVAAFTQRAGSASYGATKSWLSSFTEGLYLDLKKKKSAVTVQALCPGFTYSEFHDLLHEDRNHIAPPSFWLTADEVVDASLRALARRRLFVIPGWRYKLVVALLTKLPVSWRTRLEY